MQQLDLCLSSEELLSKYFEGLYQGEGKSTIQGGQTAANDALENLDTRGYAANRSEVLPLKARGASVLSPYIRHNLLTLRQVWDRVSDAPAKDREKFRDELLWQEYARHLYARVGKRMFSALRFEPEGDGQGDGWNREMQCIDMVVTELEQDGWLVNQTRMWLASHWSVRNGMDWRLGQERMYRELIDGSRAANLLGWQWTVGAGAGKPYGFARWQVEKRAPGVCMRCPLNKACPIQEFPQEQVLDRVERDPLVEADPNPKRTAGPHSVLEISRPEVVLLTIDSLGDSDSALVANPDLPVVFVFNEQALAKLQLSSKRIHFYLETLKDLANRRDLSVYLGSPYEFAQEVSVAVTFAPVPSFAKFKKIAQLHPYPWLVTPHAGSVRSFSAWREKLPKIR
ncbi:MAG: hypothetical protein RLZZ138_92 [Actinomycetota bacterium]|jgi:deoxyribodipyrimidine photo-lyase